MSYNLGVRMPRHVESPKSVFKQIADSLTERIESGEYPRGSMLPSEWELAEEFEVSRVTINKAVGELRAAGLVRVERGRGVAVSLLPRIERRAQARYQKGTREKGVGAYDVEMRKLGLEPATELSISEEPASAEVANLLGIDEGQPVVVRRRRMMASGEPTQLADTYIALEIAEEANLKQEKTGPGGMYSRLGDIGLAVAKFTEDITCRAWDARERDALKLDVGQPVFQVTNTTWTKDGRPTSVTYHVMPGSVWSLHYEWASGE